jgi:hypothetical protein
MWSNLCSVQTVRGYGVYTVKNADEIPRYPWNLPFLIALLIVKYFYTVSILDFLFIQLGKVFPGRRDTNFQAGKCNLGNIVEN